MNMAPDTGAALAVDLAENLAATPAAAEAAICPPHPLLGAVAAALSAHGAVALGGQDCHSAEKGAHTGDSSAEMLRAVGCRFVIVGHSERRASYGEDDAAVRAKAEAALRAGLTPIICVGESLEDRDAGRAVDVVSKMTTGSVPAGGPIVVAYEPVWAIGTGRTPQNTDVAEIARAIRAALAGHAHVAQLRVLYGGSVNAEGAPALFAEGEVDGALVGGASLKSESFSPIIRAAG